MTGSDVIVIGGGLAGMAAAIRAADDGAHVRLFERAPRLGGATRSFVRDGVSYDNGQHVFMRCCTEYLRFLERIGSREKVVLQSRMDVAVQVVGGPRSRLRRVQLPAPAHLSPALLRYRPLDLVDRLRVVRTALALRRLDLGDRRLDEQTVGAWLAEHGASPAAVERLWNLVCLPTVNLAADEASLLLAAKVFRTGLLDRADGGDIGWSAVPLQALHGDAAARVLAGLGAQVVTGARVDAVAGDGADGGRGGGATVVVDGQRHRADAVVVAVPHEVVGRLLPPGTFAEQADVAKLGRSPIVNVHLLYDRPVMDEPFLAGIGTDVQFVFDRTASSGVPPGGQMLAISLSAADEHSAWARSRLVAHFAAEVARLLPRARDATVVSAVVTREPAATFRGVPRTARHRPGPRTRLDGVFLAGAWTDTGWPATMEGAVRSGVNAAAAARQHLDGRWPAWDHTRPSTSEGAAA